MNAPRELDVLTAALQDVGFSLVDAADGPMDSGAADYAGHGQILRVVRDHGQWFLEGSREELEPADLWRAFDTTAEFRDAVVAYLSQRYA